MDAALWRSIEELHDGSFAWARACTGSESDAEDVLQNVYEKIASGRARFERRSSLKTWLFGVIRLTASEHRRRAWLRAIVPPRARISSVPISPEQDAARSEIVRELLAALETLPLRQRQIVHLVFYEDMTVEAAAAEIGVSVGTARVHYDRAKKALFARLERKEGLDALR
jgi:RNA polymerase sigma factor (sigma-70 family)